MSRCVLIALFERRNEGLGERHVRALQILGELSLMLVHAEEPLRCERRNEEQRRRPGRNLRVRQRQDRDRWRVERNGREEKRCKRSQQSPNAATADPGGEGCEQHVEALGDERGAEGRDHQAAEGR